MASGAPARSRTVRAFARGLLALVALGLAAWIVLDLVRRGERMAHESMHWASGFAMPAVDPPSGIGADGAYSEGYSTPGEDFVVKVTAASAVNAPDVRVFRDRSLCGDTVWPYPSGGGPSGMVDGLVWLEGVTSGSPFYPVDVSISNGGCYLYPQMSVTGIGATLTVDNYLYTTEVLRASLMDDGAQTVLDQWAMGDMSQLNYTPDQHRITLDRPGLVELQSIIRPWEIAFVLVCEHAYCSLTDWEGKAYLYGVPRGTYTLHAWHFLTGEVTQPLVVDERTSGQEIQIAFP